MTATAGGRSAGTGEVLAFDREPIEVRVGVQGVPDATFALNTDRGRVHQSTGSALWGTDAAESAFVRVEVRNADGSMAALSNPVWLR